ncbi:MAG: GAF domain-containing protein [Hyphomicrobiaceae bacterium]|nr:GAF domain-containing protein [Hyphomicrobiaceae bacterium]
MQPTRIVDTSNCDREPIHLPGSIQSRGVLLACTGSSWKITHASANAADLFRRKPEALLGASLLELIGAGNIADLEASQQQARSLAAPTGRILGMRLKGSRRRFNAVLHTYMGQRIFEIEPALDEAAVPPLDLVGAILARLQEARTIVELCSATAHEVRELIGYDRVLVYRFLHDGAGQVIAEARNDDLESLIDLRYPASDIPRQARELYKKSWIRLISDVDAEPVAIQSERAAQKQQLDLSFADLRSVSPIHIQYLKNMNVAASMSISIIVGGELWGLIACHHRTARLVPANLRAASELLGQVFSLQIQTVEGIEAYVTMRAARALLDRVVAEFPADGELIDNLTQRLEQIAAFISCDGAGVWIDGMWRSWRLSPTADEAKRLAQFVDARLVRSIYASHELTREYPEASNWHCGACGLLAIPLSNTNSDWLFFFRKEITQIVTWAGDPSNKVMASGSGNGLSPRTSFAAWKEEVRGQSMPWSARERLIGETLRVYLLDIIVRFSEVILEERRQAEQRQRLMTSQLNHRVKGTLELIQSLVHHGFEADNQVREFVRTLEGRIKAIALAHDAISTTNGCDIRHLVESAIAVHAPTGGSVKIAGPDVCLEAKAYTVLALVVHEMVTNSAGYGALSQSDGSLTVRWQGRDDGSLLLTWEEENVFLTTAPPGDSLGMLIIKRNIPHALGGEARIEFEQDSIHAMFAVPARHVVTQRGRTPLVSRQRLLAQPSNQLESCAILVAEDHIATALDLERILRESGAAGVEIVGTVSDALHAIAQAPPDIAILDIDLGEDDCFDIADELARQAVPFIFAGSESDSAVVPPQHRDVPIASKPYSGESVVALLKDALLPHLIRTVLTKLV